MMMTVGFPVGHAETPCQQGSNAACWYNIGEEAVADV